MPRLCTRNALLNGISMKPPVASRVTVRKASRWRGSVIVWNRCMNGLCSCGLPRWPSTGFSFAEMTARPATPSTASTMNGACQFQRFDRNSPSGRPSTWLAANAVWIRPITRPRNETSNRSVAIASTTEPITPPNRPVNTRAASSSSKVGARPHHSVPTRKPV